MLSGIASRASPTVSSPRVFCVALKGRSSKYMMYSPSVVIWMCVGHPRAGGVGLRATALLLLLNYLLRSAGSPRTDAYTRLYFLFLHPLGLGAIYKLQDDEAI